MKPTGEKFSSSSSTGRRVSGSSEAHSVGLGSGSRTERGPSLRLLVGGLLLIGGVLLASCGPVAAQQAGAFARMGMEARGMAMGNALVADRAGGGDPYHNPALAAYGDRSVSATFGVLAADRELQTIGFRTPLPPTAGISIGLIHGGVNEIDGRDPSGYHTRTYSSDEYAAQADFGFRLAERLALGLGLRLYRTSLTERLEAANTLGLRAGVLARVTSDLTLGLAAGDLLSGYRWDSSSLYEGQGARVNDQFPVRLRAGGAYRLWADRLRLHAEYEGRFVRGERIVETVELVGGSPRTVRRVEPVSSLRGVFRVGAEWIATGSFRVRGGLSGLRASAPRPIEPSAGFAIREHVRGVPLRLSYAAVLEPYVTQPVHVVSLRVELSDASE